jgi:hypothetical protein
MAATKWLFFNNAKIKLLNGTFDLDTLQMRMGLFKNSASLSVSMFNASILAQLSNTVNSAGYKGQATLTPVVEVQSTSSALFSIGSIVYTATGGDITSIQYAVIYESSGTFNLLCFCRLSTAAFNVTSGNKLTISNAAGVCVLSGGTTE